MPRKIGIKIKNNVSEEDEEELFATGREIRFPKRVEIPKKDAAYTLRKKAKILRSVHYSYARDSDNFYRFFL